MLNSLLSNQHKKYQILLKRVNILFISSILYKNLPYSYICDKITKHLYCNILYEALTNREEAILVKNMAKNAIYEKVREKLLLKLFNISTVRE